jgi:hypothetical protein
MFTKEEKRDLIRRFWSQFDVFCLSVPELAGRKKKWILHDTKISHLDLKFDVGKDFAMVALEINHRNDELRFKIFELIERYRPMLESGFPEGLIWDFCYIRNNGQEVCRIYKEFNGVDFHKISDWLQIYTFFAENMLKLQDNFLQIQEYLADEILALLREE